MAEQYVVAELLAKKHIAKYLQRKLDPALAGQFPLSDELARHIAELCPWRVRALPSTDHPLAVRSTIRFVLAGEDPKNLDPLSHNRILDMVESVYRSEFHSTVDQLYLRVKVPLGDAIDLFRKEYHITEDDYPLKSSQKCYERYFWRTYPDLARNLRRGRPRRPLMALSEAYRRRVERSESHHARPGARNPSEGSSPPEASE